MHKPYTIDDEATATLADWMRCYWYAIKRQPEIWLRGYTVDEIRTALRQVLLEQENRVISHHTQSGKVS